MTVARHLRSLVSEATKKCCRIWHSVRVPERSLLDGDPRLERSGTLAPHSASPDSGHTPLTLCGEVIAAADRRDGVVSGAAAALVELRTTEMSRRCAGCRHRGGCQPWFLRQRTLRLHATNPMAATVGQQVRVVIAAPALLRGAVAGFLVPVVLMVAGSVVSAVLVRPLVPEIGTGGRDLVVLVAALAGLAGGLFAYRVHLARRWTEMPCRIIAIMAESTPHQRG